MTRENIINPRILHEWEYQGDTYCFFVAETTPTEPQGFLEALHGHPPKNIDGRPPETGYGFAVWQADIFGNGHWAPTDRDGVMAKAFFTEFERILDVPRYRRGARL